MLVLSPMSGYTCSAYRRLIKEIEPNVILVTEFVSSDAITYNSKKTFEMLAYDKSEHPILCQIFGKHPENFVRAAKVIQSLGFDGIDINMGCPARKVIRSEHGSALARIENRDTALKIVEDVVKSVSIPVSVKTRLGWKDSKDLLDFAKSLESAGCRALMIHGRTTGQQYSGSADYEPIYAVKRELSIPVLGNGDIVSAATAKEKLGNLDGLLVARGTWGNPWVMKDVRKYFDTGVVSETSLSIREKIPTIVRHAQLMVEEKGEEKGIMEMRKFLLMYLKGFPGARDMRRNLVSVSTLTDVQSVLSEVAAICS